MVLLTVFSACTYQTDEEYFREVSQQLGTPVIELLNIPDQDTIKMYQARSFNFGVSVSKGAILLTQVLYDGVPITSEGIDQGRIDINGPLLTTGIHELKVQFTSTTETGSLADVTGQEFAVSWRRWILDIDVDPPPPLIVVVSNENGFLKLSWNQYLKPENFLDYRVSITRSNVDHKVIFIKDRNTTFWIDSTYVGGPISYHVATTTSASKSAVQTIEINEPLHVSYDYTADDSTLHFKWNKIKYKGALEKIVINEGEDGTILGHDFTDSVFHYKLKNVLFGQPSTVDFEIVPKNAWYPNHRWRVYQESPLGPKYSFVKQVQWQTGSRRLIVVYKDNRVSVLNTDLRLIDSFLFEQDPWFVVDVADQADVLYYKLNNNIYQLSLTTRQSRLVANSLVAFFVKDFALTAGGDEYVIDSQIFGRPGNYFFTRQGFDTHPTRAVNNLSELLTLGNDSTKLEAVKYPAASMNGEFIYLPEERNFYTFTRINQSSEAVYRSTLPVGFKWLQFRPDVANEIIVQNNATNEIQFVSIEDFSVKASFALPALNYAFKSYDPYTRRILVGIKGKADLAVINIDDDVTKLYQAAPVEISLMGGYLVAPDGYFFKLPL